MRQHLWLVFALAGCGQLQSLPYTIPGIPYLGPNPNPSTMPNLPEGTPDFIQLPGDQSPPVQFLPNPSDGSTPSDGATPDPSLTPGPIDTNPDVSQLTSAEQSVLDQTNKARQSAGVGPLKIDMAITQIARARSKDMGDKNYFSHTSPTGETANSLLKSAGISFTMSGENIAKGSGTPDSTVNSIFNAWMNSSGHKANILNKGYGRIGIGVVAAGNTVYYTQVFTN